MVLVARRAGPTFGVPARRSRVSFDEGDYGPSEKVRRSAGALGDPEEKDNEGMVKVMADIAYNLDLTNKRAEDAAAGKMGTL
eukprot:9500247-Pyramimonas_sp.AAC.1